MTKMNGFVCLNKTNAFGKISNMNKDYLLSSKYTLLVRNYEIEDTELFAGKYKRNIN